MSGAMIDGDIGLDGVAGATPTGGSQASGTSGTALSRHVGWSKTKPGLMGWETRHTMVGATSCAGGFVAAACAADSIAIAAGCVGVPLWLFLFTDLTRQRDAEFCRAGRFSSRAFALSRRRSRDPSSPAHG
jgi:hypothetical protein